MKNLNLSNIKSTRIATIILSILLVSSTFAVFASADIYGSDRITKNLELRVDPVTGMPYGDLSQYEWVSAGNGGNNSRYSAGPAPNSPTLLWSASLVSGANHIPTAFNGLVFGGGSTIRAFNATTGVSVFNASQNGGAPGFGSNNDVVKFNDELWGYLSSSGVVWYNFTVPPDGVTKTPLNKTTITDARNARGDNGYTSVGASGSAMYWGSMYDYESKTWTGVTTNSTSGRPLAIGFDCSDLLNQGAPIKWAVELGAGLEALGYGGGNAYFGGWGEGIIYALDIDSGDIVWQAFKSGNAGYSITYYDGWVYHSASSTQITALDGATGATMKVFDVVGGRAFFSYGGAAAYGMYIDSSIQVPQGWTGAWNAKTLEQLWKQPSEYTIKYLVGVVGDGKFFTTTNDVNRGSLLPAGGTVSDGYRVTAFDVFTGQQVWNLATSGSVLSPCIAYGNLYMTWGNVMYCYSDTAATPDGTTDWPFFGGPTYAAGTITGQYPSDIRTTAWDFQADGPITGSPVAVNGKVYFGTFAGTLYCVDANTATEVWTFKVGARILSTPAVVNGVVYTGADDGKVYALDANAGTVMWTQNAGGVTQGPLQTAALQLNPSPIVYQGKVIVGAQDGQLYCFNANSGQVNWIANVSNTRNGVGGTVAIVPQDLNGLTKVLIVANARLFSLNINNGAVLTNFTVQGGSALREVCKPTVVGNDFVFVESASGSGYLTMYNATTMEQLAQARLTRGSGSTPTISSPAYLPSYTAVIKNQTNIGWGTLQNQTYIINQTTDAPVTRSLNLVIAIEAQEISAWALIANGTNLGGNTAATRWTVNSSTPYYMVRLWNNWVGHQSFGNPIVAINAQTPGANAVVYEGNSVYGFTAYNCTDGAVLSTYTATAQVFTTPALYQNRVYMTDSAGILHCFTTKEPEFMVPIAQIFGESNKGAEMFANEPMTVSGKLTVVQVFQTDIAGPEVFQPGLPYTPVHFTFVNPDGTSTTETIKTDADGNFNFTVTPTQTGQASWLVYFDGAATLDGQYMDGAYSPYASIDVVQEGSGGQPTPTQTATSTGTSGPIAMEYIIAAIVAVIVVVAVVAALVVMRRKK